MLNRLLVVMAVVISGWSMASVPPAPTKIKVIEFVVEDPIHVIMVKDQAGTVNDVYTLKRTTDGLGGKLELYPFIPDQSKAPANNGKYYPLVPSIDDRPLVTLYFATDGKTGKDEEGIPILRPWQSPAFSNTKLTAEALQNFAGQALKLEPQYWRFSLQYDGGTEKLDGELNSANRDPRARGWIVSKTFVIQ